MQYNLVDTDAHIVDPPDMWERYMPKNYHDDMPRMVKDEKGGDAWEFGRGVPPRPLGMVVTPGQRYEDMHWLGAKYSDFRKGCWDGKARLEDMDFDGIDAQVLYPWPSLINYFMDHPDDGMHKAAIEAYNNWVFNEFAGADHDRLFPMFQMPNLGIETSLAELRRAKKEGFRGVILLRYPSGNLELSDEDEPFWAEAEEMGMPLHLHISIGGATRAQAAQAGKPEVISSPSGNMLLVSPFAGFALILIKFIASGIFDRYPKLQMVSVENQAGWIPSALEFYDDRYWRNRTAAGSTLKLLPSHYFQRNWSATFIIDHYAVQNRHTLGVKNIMWSTDYPHHGNDWPYSRKVIDDMFYGVSDEDRHAITCGNAMKLYGLVNS